MAQDIVSGLFGMSPYEAQQQSYARDEARANAAAAAAGQTPGQMMARAYSGMGSSLGRIGAGLMGMEDPAVAQARQREQAMSGLDMSSPEAIMQRAQQIQDPRLKMQLMMAARDAQAKQQQAMLAIRKDTREQEDLDFKRKEAFDLKKMEAEARIRQNDQRIQDARTTAQERMELQRENNQIKMMIAGMRSGGQGMTANELRQQKYEDAMAEKEQKKIESAQSGIDSLESIRRNVNDLYDETTGKLKPAATTLFGRVDQFRGSLTLTEESTNALSSLDGLKDQITMTNLADAKKMVGQSFGSMQVQEWDKFVRLLSSLDRSIGEEKAAENLKYILDFINKKSDVLNVALGAGKTTSTGGWSIRPKGQ